MTDLFVGCISYSQLDDSVIFYEVFFSIKNSYGLTNEGKKNSRKYLIAKRKLVAIWVINNSREDGWFNVYYMGYVYQSNI